MQAPEQLYSPFSSPDWLYEIKYDGWRSLASIHDGQVRLHTKALRDCTRSFPEVVSGLSRIAGGPHVIDGELAVLGEHGVSDFNAFHLWRGRTRISANAPAVTFCAFDMPQFDGQDITGWPLERRKVLLQLLLLEAEPGAVLFVDDMPADADLFRLMVGAGLPIEGVVAKRRDSRYLPGVRSDSWRKIKRAGWREGRHWTN
jgi:ATP-dependent DNA ligase